MSSKPNFRSRFDRFRHSNSLAVVIVYATLMIDNMLLTSIVPILPEYLLETEESVVGTTTIPYTTTGGEDNNLKTTNSNGLANSTNETTEVVLCEEKREKDLLAAKNLFLAFLLASKPLVQVLANAGVGPLCDKIGYDIPMFFGYIVLISSSIIFAFGQSFAVLFLARALQGIGSACAATAGMAMLANRYRDDDERGRMLGLALGGLAMGVLVGPTFASVTYQFTGKEMPFLILGGATFLVALLQLCTRQFHLAEGKQQVESKSSLLTLLKDPYILLAASALMLGNMGIGVLETALPTWMMSTMCAEKWQLGAALLPVSVSYLIVTMVFARLGTSGTRWLICFLSYFVSALGCFILPFCKEFLQLIGPGLLVGTAAGMVDATIFPILGHLADIRHAPIYGSVYAIADASFCVAFILGPLLAGTVVHEIGFNWVMIIVALLNLAFAPLVCFLRKPKALSEEEKGILSSDVLDTVTYDPNLSPSGRVVDTKDLYETLK